MTAKWGASSHGPNLTNYSHGGKTKVMSGHVATSEDIMTYPDMNTSYAENI